MADGGAIDIVGPVGVVVIHIIIISRRVIVEEPVLDGRIALGVCLDRSQHLRSVGTILAGIHQRGKLRHEAYTGIDVGIDACCHGVSALGGNQDDAIGTTCAIEGCGILQHLHLVDVLRGDIGEDVIKLPTMQCGTVLLHVLLDAINHDERLGIGIQRIETTDKHGGTGIRGGRANDAMHVGSHVVGNLIVYGHGMAVGNKAVGGGVFRGIVIHLAISIRQHEDADVLGRVVGIHGNLLREERR